MIRWILIVGFLFAKVGTIQPTEPEWEEYQGWTNWDVPGYALLVHDNEVLPKLEIGQEIFVGTKGIERFEVREIHHYWRLDEVGWEMINLDTNEYARWEDVYFEHWQDGRLIMQTCTYKNTAIIILVAYPVGKDMGEQ